MPRRGRKPGPRDPNQTASGKPGAVHDHGDINYTPFKDAIQLTVAADASSGSQLTVVESIPSLVATMATCGAQTTPSNVLANCGETTVPFNGGSVTINLVGGAQGARRYWGVFNASNPDSMYNA